MSSFSRQTRGAVVLLSLICVLLLTVSPLAAHGPSAHGHSLLFWSALQPLALFGVLLTIPATWSPVHLILARNCAALTSPTSFQIPPPSA